jgi:hypothetical protein
MIDKVTRTDIFNTTTKHIAFPINVSGENKSGFVNYIVEKYWPELLETDRELGDILYKEIEDRILYALVCKEKDDYWGKDQQELLTICLNKIVTDDIISLVAIGNCPSDKTNGADIIKIINGVNNSKNQVVIHDGIENSELYKSYKTLIKNKK